MLTQRVVEALGNSATRSELLGRPSTHRPELDRFRLFDAVNRFVQAPARTNPILLALDDLHWADRSSLRLLEFVARGLPRSRVLIVGTCRSTRPSQPDPLADVLRLTVCRTLPLDGLEARDTRSIIADILATQPSAELVRGAQWA